MAQKVREEKWYVVSEALGGPRGSGVEDILAED